MHDAESAFGGSSIRSRIVFDTSSGDRISRMA
jgi:hypothetical protein